jgi:SAM-dependent methyltransferase
MTRHNLHEPRSTRLTKLWIALLRYQTDFSFPLELPFFYDCPSWLQAQRVMDLGTGTGEHLFRLHSYFPEKIFSGIDVSSDYIEIARKRFSQGRGDLSCCTHFEVGDIYGAKGTFDVVLARLLLQHLPDLDRFLERTSQILVPGGALIVVDSNDSARIFVPELPHMRNLFDELRLAQKRTGSERDAIRLLKAKAPLFGFKLVREAYVTVPSSLPTYKSLFYKSYRTVFGIVRLNYGLQQLDYKALNEELSNWYSLSNSYAQIGVHLACYVKG